MKNSFRLILVFLMVSLFACEKNLVQNNQQWEFADPTLANVKIVNAYTSNIPAGAPGVGVTRFYAYQDGAKLNGNAVSAAGAWPGTATYASLKPGNSTFTLILDRRVGTNYGNVAKGDTAFNSKFNIEAGKYYSIFMIGESPTQSMILINDNIKDPTEKTYAFRFANMVVSATPKPVDVYSRREKKNIASNVPFKTVTDFIEISIPTTSDTLDVREAGKTINLYSFNNFNPTSRRIYTFYNFGRVGGAGFAERLTNYTNR